MLPSIKFPSQLRYTVLLALCIGLFLVVVGLGPQALPFPVRGSYSDAVVSHWPAALFLQQSVRSGTWPFWRALLMSGQPFAANPLNKVWYPPQWLVIFLPVTLHLNLLIWAHLILAGVGMRALLNRLGLHPQIAAVMGVAYALTPRLISALGAGHLDIVYAIAWFPWVLWAVHCTITGSRPLGQRIVSFGGICALCFLADIRLSVFIFATGGAFAVRLLVPAEQKGRALIGLVLGALLAVGLTAVQWLPLLELAPYLSRGDMTTQSASAFSLQPVQLAGLILPDQGGSHETMVYAGLVVLILALIGLVRTFRQNGFWAVVALIAALYAFGDQGLLWPTLVRWMPPLLWLRVPPRTWIVAVVAITILASYGTQALLEPRIRWISLLGMALIGAGAAWGFTAPRLNLPPGILISPLIGLLATGSLILLRQRLRSTMLIILVGVLIVLDVTWTDVTLVQGRPESSWLDFYAPLGQALRDAGVTAVYSPDYSLPQQVAAYWNIPTFGGVDPFQFKTYVPAFDSATGTHGDTYSVTLPAYDTVDPTAANRNAVIDARQLARWNVSHVLSSFPINTEGLQLTRRIGDLYLYENVFRPKQLSIAWENSNRLTANNRGDQPVNVSAWAPGWPSIGDQTAIVVTPGQSLTLDYQPPGLIPSLLLSVTSVVVAIIALRKPINE